ncbi:hypothetical protein LR48_Vigan01g041000 [Vigna angularis]|uniref:Uncharacterized protein n=1 Tax=Phaseolus angularis TaxID=3914 RepID=A0A0L9TJY0_PHAAN|nr:hypothetical protein LR48_Vigan01g041000 [Vigna angularis]
MRGVPEMNMQRLENDGEVKMKMMRLEMVSGNVVEVVSECREDGDEVLEMVACKGGKQRLESLLFDGGGAIGILVTLTVAGDDVGRSEVMNMEVKAAFGWLTREMLVMGGGNGVFRLMAMGVEGEWETKSGREYGAAHDAASALLVYLFPARHPPFSKLKIQK